MKAWAEIRNDYVDENDISKGFVTMYIDAWKTPDDNEGGKSIAEIKLIVDKDTPLIEIIYKDNKAKTDEYAQEMIREGVEFLKQEYIKDRITE